MNYGHFSSDGWEYVVTDPNTPRPWINFLTNDEYCSVISATGGGYSFFKDSKTGVIDLVMDPSDPETLYAGTADRRRYRWNDPMPTFRSGIHKTTDGGKTWKTLTSGLPDFGSNEYERVGIDVCAAHPETVYAVVNRAAGDTKTKKLGAYLYRSDDKGETWRETEGNDKINGVFSDYGWYFGQVRADPVDPETVYVMGLGFRRSKDGGKTWESLRGNHTDYHGAWIDPKNPAHILAANDGGLTISKDAFASFEHPNNLPIAQLYNVSISQAKGTFRMFSSRQDMGGYMGEATVGPNREITWKDWESGPGDESGRHAVDPTNPNLVYFVNRYGGGPFLADFAQDNPRTKKPPLSKDITPKGVEPRAQWVSPIIVSPHDPARILYGAQFVFLSDDQGKTWRRISPDLTDFDPSKRGNIPYSTVFAIAESPMKKGLIYAGTDDGLMHVTVDEGKTWKNITAGLPAERFISSIEASRFDAGTVYVTVNGKRNDEFSTLLFKSADFGRTWTNLTPAFPGNNANVVREDPTDRRILYLGTDQGVAVSVNGGLTWSVLGTGLPTVYVHDIAIQTQEHVAVIATHGRGAYAIDLLPVRSGTVGAGHAHAPKPDGRHFQVPASKNALLHRPVSFSPGWLVFCVAAIEPPGQSYYLPQSSSTGSSSFGVVFLSFGMAFLSFAVIFLSFAVAFFS